MYHDSDVLKFHIVNLCFSKVGFTCKQNHTWKLSLNITESAVKGKSNESRMEVNSDMGKSGHVIEMADIILSEKLSEQGVTELLSVGHPNGEHPEYNKLHIQKFLYWRK